MRMTRRRAMATMFGVPIAVLLGLWKRGGVDKAEGPATLSLAELDRKVARLRDPFAGKIYRAQVYDGIDGSLVFDFTGPTIKWQTSMDGVYWRDSASLGTVVFR